MCLAWGSVRIPLSRIPGALFGGTGSIANIVRVLRLPRAIGSLLSGIALSASGLLLQSATDNDLCAPNVIGVNSGAGFAVMLTLCFLPKQFALLPFAAFGGAFLTTLLVLGIATSVGSHQGKSTIILSGIAVSALMNAGISFLSQLYPDILGSYSYFSVGGFQNVYMSNLPIPAGIIFLGLAAAALLTPKLNLLCLGDDLATALGVRVTRVRILSLILASALCAASVTYAGLLGFVGLLVPHMARKLAGHDMRVLLPVTCTMGAILVMLADLAGRTFFAPAEISAGTLLAVLGAPFFLFLLYQRRYRRG